MNFDDDSIIGRFIQRWAFMAYFAMFLLIVWWGLQTIYHFPSYVIRWYHTDEPKESNYFGWRCFGMLMGIYAFLLFFGSMVFYDSVSDWWPTLSSLYIDDSGFGQPQHLLSVICDCLLFAGIAWLGRRHAEKLGFLEADPETGVAVFYPYVGQ
jgi:hypothetical protein